MTHEKIKSNEQQSAFSAWEDRLHSLRHSCLTLRHLPSHQKNQILVQISQLLAQQCESILLANKKDVEALSPQTSPAFRDRLTLNAGRIQAMQASLTKIAELPDPVGEIVEVKTLPNGLHLRRVLAPLGCLFMIFEARPNVITEAVGLAFKSGNSLCLRGGSDSQFTSAVIYQLIDDAFRRHGFYPPPFLGIREYDRDLVNHFLERHDIFDVVIPRGGDRLISLVQEKARMPIIKNDRGLCHAYVDEAADLGMAIDIVSNGKVQRPGVCNSLETLLVHEAVATVFLPQLFQKLKGYAVQWYCDDQALQILRHHNPLDDAKISLATTTNWNTEYLDYALNCKIVKSIDEAMEHIEKHGSKHSETIVTHSRENAELFQKTIDAAAVYWNASTRFTDGYEFGLGGEIGISTQKLHVRGPVGLRELTSPRWLINGQGQIRT